MELAMFGKNPSKELPIPSVAAKDAKSLEILRVWIAGGGQQVSLKSMVWEDPAAWGLLLADIAQHVSKSYARDAGLDKDKVLERIKQGFDAEMSNPTDPTEASN